MACNSGWWAGAGAGFQAAGPMRGGRQMQRLPVPPMKLARQPGSAARASHLQTAPAICWPQVWGGPRAAWKGPKMEQADTLHKWFPCNPVLFIFLLPLTPLQLKKKSVFFRHYSQRTTSDIKPFYLDNIKHLKAWDWTWVSEYIYAVQLHNAGECWKDKTNVEAKFAWIEIWLEENRTFSSIISKKKTSVAMSWILQDINTRSICFLCTEWVQPIWHEGWEKGYSDSAICRTEQTKMFPKQSLGKRTSVTF